jgi:hypothetical protein
MRTSALPAAPCACASSCARFKDGIARLLEREAEIEHALFITLRDLFSLKVGIYDLTSTYFEGQGPPGTGLCGHSRDAQAGAGGLVVVDGWPIAHHVFEGNRRDS